MCTETLSRVTASPLYSNMYIFLQQNVCIFTLSMRNKDCNKHQVSLLRFWHQISHFLKKTWDFQSSLGFRIMKKNLWTWIWFASQVSTVPRLKFLLLLFMTSRVSKESTNLTFKHITWYQTFSSFYSVFALKNYINCFFHTKYNDKNHNVMLAFFHKINLCSQCDRLCFPFDSSELTSEVSGYPSWR